MNIRATLAALETRSTFPRASSVMDEDLPDEIPEVWKYHLPVRPGDIQHNLPYRQLYHHEAAQNEANLGALDLLPTELLQDTLGRLD